MSTVQVRVLPLQPTLWYYSIRACSSAGQSTEFLTPPFGFESRHAHQFFHRGAADQRGTGETQAESGQASHTENTGQVFEGIATCISLRQVWGRSTTGTVCSPSKRRDAGSNPADPTSFLPVSKLSNTFYVG